MPSPDGPFIATVTGEVRDQVERLRHHACMALWCGNNELEVAWNHWGWQQRYGLHGRDSAVVAGASVTLFEHWLPEFIGEHCDIPYVRTSPLSNWGSEEGLRSGDLHYWGVWHGDSAITSLSRNVGRFVSEYGFQSYPDSSLLATTLDPEHLRLGDPMLVRMQRSYKTDAPIWKAIEERTGSRPATLGAFIEAGQQVQAAAYRIAAEAHLAARPHCMGTLFWQLNDPWPGPSWSLIDAAGNWKPGMFAIQEVYGR
jgi:beta-mannosidase